MSEYVLELKNVSKSFGATKANVDISLSIKPGELRGLVGENGSGKSTLINSISGIHRIDSGEMFINGEKYDPHSPIDAHKQGIGFVVQEIGLVDALDIATNMFLGNMERFKKGPLVNTSRMAQEAKAELNKWGFGAVPVNAPAGTLSIEKSKMAEITKALSTDPKVVIFDETTQSLSYDTRRQLYKIIDGLKEKGVAIVMITHDLEEIVDLADSISVLRDGHLIGTVEKADIDLQKIKNMMVGRVVDGKYYREDSKETHTEDVILKAENISRHGFFKDVSFEVHAGEILGFGGLSDAGIHEIGRAVFGLDPIQSGEITFVPSNKKIKKALDATSSGIAYIPKDRDSEALMMQAPIRDNMYMPSLPELESALWFMSPKKCTDLSQQAADDLNVICTNINQAVTALSGGNKQKVNLGRWLIKDLSVLLMDCPTRGVDVGVKAYIYQLMQELKEKKVAMILISDELPELMGMCDRVVVMKNGEVASILSRTDGFTEEKFVEVMI